MKPVLIKPGLFRDRRDAGRLLAEKLILQASRSEGYGTAAARGGNDARTQLGVTGHGHDQSDRYDHGD